MNKTKKPIEDWERIEEDDNKVELKKELRQERKQNAKRR